MKYLILFSFVGILFFSCCLVEEEITFKGKVFDENGAVVENAQIYISNCSIPSNSEGGNDLEFCGFTDSKGYYSCTRKIDCGCSTIITVWASGYEFKYLKRDEDYKDIDCDGNVADAHLVPE